MMLCSTRKQYEIEKNKNITAMLMICKRTNGRNCSGTVEKLSPLVSLAKVAKKIIQTSKSKNLLGI